MPGENILGGEFLPGENILGDELFPAWTVIREDLFTCGNLLPAIFLIDLRAHSVAFFPASSILSAHFVSVLFVRPL